MQPVRSLSTLAPCRARDRRSRRLFIGPGARLDVRPAAVAVGRRVGCPSGAASAAPSSAAPSAAPASTEPSIAPSAAASGGTGGTTVIPEVAQNIQFTNLALAAPAGQPFQIAFDNQDASVAHNIQIMDGGGATVFDGEIVTGVAQTTYNVNALAAGTYKFICKIIPTS